MLGPGAGFGEEFLERGRFFRADRVAPVTELACVSVGMSGTGLEGRGECFGAGESAAGSPTAKETV